MNISYIYLSHKKYNCSCGLKYELIIYAYFEKSNISDKYVFFLGNIKVMMLLCIIFIPLLTENRNEYLS